MTRSFRSILPKAEKKTQQPVVLDKTHDEFILAKLYELKTITGHVLTQQNLEKVSSLLNDKFHTTMNALGLRYRFDKLNFFYLAFRKMKGTPELKYDPILQKFTAPHEILENYVKFHPYVASYRSKSFEHEVIMDLIFGNVQPEAEDEISITKVCHSNKKAEYSPRTLPDKPDPIKPMASSDIDSDQRARSVYIQPGTDRTAPFLPEVHTSTFVENHVSQTLSSQPNPIKPMTSSSFNSNQRACSVYIQPVTDRAASSLPENQPSTFIENQVLQNFTKWIEGFETRFEKVTENIRKDMSSLQTRMSQSMDAPLQAYHLIDYMQLGLHENLILKEKLCDRDTAEMFLRFTEAERNLWVGNLVLVKQKSLNGRSYFWNNVS